MSDSTQIKEVLVEAGSDLVKLGDDIKKLIRETEAKYHGLVRVTGLSMRRAEAIGGENRILGVELDAELATPPAMLRKKSAP